MDSFAATCESIAGTSSRLEKVRLAAEYLRGLDDESIGIGACFLSGAPFSRVDPRRPEVGGSLLTRAAVDLTGWEIEVVRACSHATGDLSEAIGLLSAERVAMDPFTVRDARAVFDELARTRRPARKQVLLVRTLKRLSPKATKYFLKVLIGGLRIGLLEKQVEEAIALATGQPKEAVRAANVRSGDIEAVARAARAGTLDAVQANLFHPIDFMLASPLASSAEVDDVTQYLVEHKYDGIRAQVHVREGRVVLFSRGLGDVTKAFPEIAAALQDVRGPLIIDGELIAVQGARTLPFVLLQRRLARKAPSAELLRDVQVAFVAYDLLHDAEGLLFDLPLEERQARLTRDLEVVRSDRIRLSPVLTVASVNDLDALFEHARERGDEGLILKLRGTPYQPGHRGQSWLKLKRALGTLDVVITAAEQGHGQRASMLSDYTFAVRDGERFVNIGKAYSGLTDEEIRGLTRRLQSLTTERFGRMRLIRPEIVLEVAFDTVQKSARHQSGYALRFPRIIRIRDDKEPSQIDTLQRVQELYEHTVNTGRVEQISPQRPAPIDDLPLFAFARSAARH